MLNVADVLILKQYEHILCSQNGGASLSLCKYGCLSDENSNGGMFGVKTVDDQHL